MLGTQVQVRIRPAEAQNHVPSGWAGSIRHTVVEGNRKEERGVGVEAALEEMAPGEMRSTTRVWSANVSQTVLCSLIGRDELGVRRKATENIHSILRFRNRSVINIRNVSS